ncbi:predicted protein [Histoplasma mississippiense (nom. inval.)]|uniref:predicted protein n=1 Tax=Ajellomyces capsulatus (strain NAm1 / WU24) TaxID=2059318 RepID=UPI000157C968|nr:predicted protein [Histoplasma mississippiense (nom. inval.)]EDN09252.1 predicted protein [Histoplasma mississippiense (nom. inval.)]
MPNLGLFARLPYELREQIWVELAPSPAQDMGNHKTDLSVLRASHYLHDEIDEVIYRGGKLEFNIDPVYHPSSNNLCTVFFRRRHRALDVTANSCPASWTLQSVASARACGFGSVAFHKFDQVVANIPSPDPNDIGELFCLWRKVRGLVSLFSGGTQIKHMLIRLLERESDGQNWIDNLEWPSKAYTPSLSGSTCQHDHDVPILPFCTLRNLASLRVETYSEELAELMDWDVIDGLVKLVRESNGESHSDNANKKRKRRGSDRAAQSASARSELERRDAFEYYWMHTLLWTYAEGSTTADLMRRETLREWARDGSESSFEKEVRRIMHKYPEFLGLRSTNVLRDMHCVAVCLNDAAKRRRLESAGESASAFASAADEERNGNDNDNDNDRAGNDEEDWEALLPAGLPVVETREFGLAVGPMIARQVYCDNIRDEAKYTSFHCLLQSWELKFQRSIWFYMKRNVRRRLGLPLLLSAREVDLKICVG